MPATHDNITGLILAGGQGRRLDQQDKGLVELHNKPLIEYVLERLRPQTKHIIISANRNVERYRQYGHPVIQDSSDNFPGPLAGIAAAMETMQTEWLLCCPCDGPLLRKDLAQHFAENINSHTDIAVARASGNLQPVYALLRRNLLESLTNYLNQGERKVRQWYQQHDLTIVDFDANGFENINTDNDYNHVLKLIAAENTENTENKINLKT